MKVVATASPKRACSMPRRLRMMVLSLTAIFMLYSFTLMSHRLHSLSVTNKDLTTKFVPKPKQNITIEVVYKDTETFFVWRPPREYDKNLDDYLVYEHEYNEFVDQYETELKQCDDQPIPFVILITSAPKNADRRNAVRETWLRDASRYNVRYFFTLASVEDNNTMDAVKQEDEEYHDIIQMKHLDTYHNLTMKVLLSLKWADTYCSHSQFVMKTDDDMYIDLSLFMNYFARPLISRDYDEKAVFGFLASKYPVIRKNNTLRPWFVPERVYKRPAPFKDKYPTFTSGVMYIFTGSALHDIVVQAEKLLPALYVEDVFLTGFVAQYANVSRKDLKKGMFMFDGKCKLDKFKKGVAGVSYNPAAIGHYCKPEDLKWIYDYKQKLIAYV